MPYPSPLPLANPSLPQAHDAEALDGKLAFHAHMETHLLEKGQLEGRSHQLTTQFHVDHHALLAEHHQGEVRLAPLPL